MVRKDFVPRLTQVHRSAVLIQLAVCCVWLACSAEYASAQSGGKAPGSRRMQNSNGPPFAEGSSRLALPNSVGTNPFDPPSSHRNPLPVVADGYCVVTLRDERRWQAGDSQYQAVFDNLLYWFAGLRERDIFLASPLLYAPVLGGDCVVSYVEDGQRQHGVTRYGLVHRRRLYLFAGTDEIQLFRLRPEYYHDADLANAGQCLVSRYDHQRKIAGLPAATAMVDGLRYQFVGVYERGQFLADPGRYGVVVSARTEHAGELPGQPVDRELSGAKPIPLASTPELLVQDDDDAPESLPLVMEGYCPVSFRDQGVWADGLGQFRVPHDGGLYLLADQEFMEKFLENPRLYLPVLGGDCVVTFVKTGQRLPGSVNHAVQDKAHDRLYLFTTAEQKARFNQDPARYLDADLAKNGNCVVSAVERQQQIAGDPQFSALVRGMRYHFATSEYREKFLTDPTVYLPQTSATRNR